MTKLKEFDIILEFESYPLKVKAKTKLDAEVKAFKKFNALIKREDVFPNFWIGGIQEVEQ
jgi:hypothetical protein